MARIFNTFSAACLTNILYPSREALFFNTANAFLPERPGKKRDSESLFFPFFKGLKMLRTSWNKSWFWKIVHNTRRDAWRVWGGVGERGGLFGKKKGKKGRKGEDRKSRGRGKKGDLPAQPPSNRLGQTVRDKQDAKNLSFFFFFFFWSRFQG